MPAASASAKGRDSTILPSPAAMRASISASISGPAAAPLGDLTLKPLSIQGLWLAVMTMPAAAFR